MEPEHVNGNKDNLPHKRDNQQNYENSIPQRLSFLNDPFCALGEQVSAIRQNAENSHGQHSDCDGEEHPRAPPAQRPSGHEEQDGVKSDIKDNASYYFGNGHRMFWKMNR